MAFGIQKAIAGIAPVLPFEKGGARENFFAEQLCQILDLEQVNWKISSHKEALVSFTDSLPRLESRTFFGIEKPLLELLLLLFQ